MSTEIIGWLIVVVEGATLIAVTYVLPFVYVLKSGRFWRGVLISWLRTVAVFFAFFCTGEFLRLHVDKKLTVYCSDGPAFLAACFVGWMPVMISAGTAYGLHRRRQRLARNQVERPNQALEATPPSGGAPQL
jgi:hypothetical protein